MKHATLLLSAGSVTPVQVEVLEASPDGKLFAHRAVEMTVRDGKTSIGPAAAWCVTHAASGLTIARRLESAECAVAVLRALVERVDWSKVESLGDLLCCERCALVKHVVSETRTGFARYSPN